MNSKNLVKWAKSQLGSNRRSRKGISVIMANLTMLIIVVFLSALLFTWAITSFGLYQGGAGFFFSSKSLANQERISVENVYFNTVGGTNNYYKIYVRNVGAIPFTIASVYINGTLLATPSPPIPMLNVTQAICLNCGGSSLGWVGPTWVHGNVQTIKVATLRGTIATSTWVS